MGEIFRSAFDFFGCLDIAGLNLNIWFVIILVITAITIFVRGNK